MGILHRGPPLARPPTVYRVYYRNRAAYKLREADKDWIPFPFTAALPGEAARKAQELRALLPAYEITWGLADYGHPTKPRKGSPL